MYLILLVAIEEILNKKVNLFSFGFIGSSNVCIVQTLQGKCG